MADHTPRKISRRNLLKLGAAAGVSVAAARIAPSISAAEAFRLGFNDLGAAQDIAAKEVLVVAARNTAPCVDHDFCISLEGHWARGLIEDKLLRYAMKETEPGSGFYQEDFNTIEGYLAESYEISPEGNVITFHLHKGITTHAGNEFTADDIIWNMERAYGLKGVNLTYFDKMLGIDGGPAGVKKIDPYTFTITLKAPNPLIARIWVNNDIGWFDATEAKKHTTEADPWATEYLTSHSAGMGPYKITEWSPGNQIVFDRHEQYYGEKPAFQRIIMKEVPASANRVALLQQGAVDVSMLLLPRARNAIKNVKGVKIGGVRQSNQDIHIGMNLSIKPFDDKRVRQAMNYAINQQEFVDAVFMGDAVAQKSLVYSIYPGWTDEGFPYKYDPEKAKALLKEAGYENGFTAKLYFETENTLAEETAVLAQTRWKEIGVNIELQKIPPSTFWERIWTSEFSMICAEFNAIVPDPGYALALFVDSESFVNWMKYKNDEVDAAIDQGMKYKDALDPERLALLKKAQQITVDDAVRVFLVEQSMMLATRDNVKNPNWLTFGTFRPQWMSKE